MPKKARWLTPDDFEAGDEICRPLFVPLELLPYVTGALALLTEVENWQEAGTMTPQIATEKFAAIIERWSSEECIMGCCLERTDPNTGIRQFSDDGGETWQDVPEVPLLPYDASVPRKTPPARQEETEEDRICLAATNAAYILRQTHISIAETLGNELANQLELATEVGEDVFVLFTMLGIAAYQPAVGLTALFVLVGIAAQFNTNPLTDDDEQRLLCILRDNATDTGGVVTFDFNGVYAAIDLDDPKQTNVREMLTVLGATALNFMGAQSVVPAGDCVACDEEPCVYFDPLTTGLGERTFLTGKPPLTLDRGQWVAGEGRTGGGAIGPTQPDSQMRISAVIDLGQECTIESVKCWVKVDANAGAFCRVDCNYFNAAMGDAGYGGFRTFSNGVGSQAYTEASFDQSSHGAGTLIRYIQLSAFDAAPSEFYIDDISINVTP